MSFLDQHTSTCICGGSGWVPVDEEYARRHAVKHRTETGAPQPGALDAYRDSFTPCHECRPNTYEMWRSGRYSPRTGSPDRAAGGARRRSRGRSPREDTGG